MNEGITISEVLPESIAEDIGIEAGDSLLSIDGIPVRDILDYTYHISAAEEPLLEIRKRDGEIWEVELQLDPNESIGIHFEPPKPSTCGNNCIFCFVHQLPKGLRKSLYVKDEDYRLSFLNGNYVTLANLKYTELQRIISLKLSPIYISVHTTDHELREKLLSISGLPDIVEQIKILASAGIRMHTQIVLMPGINDGAVLDATLVDLSAFFPAVESVAIVPVGLTDHRRGLYPLEPVSQDYAASFVKKYGKKANEISLKLGEPFVFLADEWYLKAGSRFPSFDSYGDFPQLENGVGMVPLFKREASKVLARAKKIEPVSAVVVTGVSAFNFVSDFVAKLAAKTGCSLDVLAIPNKLFGGKVTVTGLVSGQNIARAVSHCGDPPELLLVPDVMLKEGEDIFLDDMSLSELEVAIGAKVVSFVSTPSGFYSKLREICKRTGY